jgi:hypothetical protein
MYRSVEVRIWGDPWFERLKPAAKLLFLYLLTNHRQTPCGAMEVSEASIQHETGLDEARIVAAMTELAAAGKVVWWRERAWVFVVRFYKHQRALASETFATAARRAVADLPEPVRARVLETYPELAPPPARVAPAQDSLPLPSPDAADRVSDRVSDTLSGRVSTVTVTAPATATGTAAAAAAAPARRSPRRRRAELPPYSDAFDRFWAAYPNGGRSSKVEAFRVWLALDGDRIAGEIMAGLARWQASARWARGYVKDASGFLRGRMYELAPEPAAPTNGHAPAGSLGMIMGGIAAYGAGGTGDGRDLPGGDGGPVYDVAQPGQGRGDGGGVVRYLPPRAG